MEVYGRVRRAVQVDGMSMRQAAREFGQQEEERPWNSVAPPQAVRADPRALRGAGQAVIMIVMRHKLMLLSALTGALCGQGLVNPDLEQGSRESGPAGWRTTSGTWLWKSEGCAQGQGCVELTPPAAGAPNPGGILVQSIDAAPYRGKLIRYRASVLAAAPGRAGMWLRVDRSNGQIGFFDNMSDRPIVQTTWSTYEINGYVHADAVRISLGLLVNGGAATFDDASLSATEPARPLTDSGLANLTAFARLYGLVRHFHPSDEARRADWNRFAIESVKQVEAAGSPAELVSVLQSQFQPVAPSVKVYTGPAPEFPLSGGTQVVRWHNVGFDTGRPNNRYKRTRVVKQGSSREQSDLYEADLGRGIKAMVPLAVFADKDSTLPAGAPLTEERPTTPMSPYTGDDRSTRIADVVIAWNVFRHFYPYFEVVKTDWEAVLPWSLREAASVRDWIAFHTTLLKMVAELKDGHGRVSYAGAGRPGRVATQAEWIDGKFIVVQSKDLKPGDEIVAINGKPALQALQDAEKLISGATTQWKRARSSYVVLAGPAGQICTLTIRPFANASPVERKLPYKTTVGPVAPGDPRPPAVSTELEPGYWYFDLTRAQDQDFVAALPKLSLAKGIIFDMRGYPFVSPSWLSHLSQMPLRSAQWHVPQVNRPGEMTFERRDEWNLPPVEPYISGKRVFLTTGGAISYAESIMGIVEYYKLGAIVGETTAGTNGNTNPFDLPGGYTLTWTGMKVLKHDGSQHHGIGIAPTVPIARTQAGVAAGRDEVLERGLAVLKQ